MEDEQGASYVLESMLRDKNAGPTDLPLSLFRSITGNFSEDLEIGRGGFGVVYKGVLHGGLVAVKKLSDDLIEDRSFQQEVAHLMRTRHRNIVRFLGYCADTQGKMTEYQGRYVLADVRVRLLCFEYIRNGKLTVNIEKCPVFVLTFRSYLCCIYEYCGLEWHERYRIIKGVCQGLRYLHEEENIVHLDLKPDNILLDHNMVPKITDFGLSRLFNKQQTRVITSNLYGSRGYVAPEYLDHGIITFKSDIYSLGVIILEILTGKRGPCKVENVVENWKNRLQRTSSHLLLDAYCHQVKACIEIALNSMDFNSKNRPNVGAIIAALNETETSCCQEKETVTSREAELLDIQPLELRFPFELNKLIPCSLYLGNSTDHRIAFRLRPLKPERYFTEWLCGVVPPRSTYTLTVTMKEQEHPPLDIDKFLIDQSSIMDDFQLKDISQGQADVEFNNFFEEVQAMGVDMVHEQTLMAVCDPQAETTSEVSILYLFLFFLAVKFLAQKQWVIAGGGDGRIYVYSYNTMKRVKSFKALSNQITSLAIHPTKPCVLSASYDLEIKMWDSENGWKSTRKFEVEHSSSVMQVAFNPKDVKAFATISKDKTIKIWSVDSPQAHFTLAGHTSHVRCLDYFTRGDSQYLITGSDDGTAKIWDLQKKACVATLEGHTNRVSVVCSHSELPILMTGSRDGTVRLWNSNSFRLEGILNFGIRKVYALACTKGSRVVIGHSYGLAITKIDHHGRWQDKQQ
ncbi:hypothetical protein BS78_K198400 [Paspalum vaginatum]|uniref:Protein kinase domain-containing protein n=1 Tax=Paspalum vaginatum TaxID=158149 RepID=A0A9W8CD34_9POAL|nr:hypothetical protein BS78_K198400 [Paspalum vaginatum]KAJ1253751.1 hypothetical protein BS78_K198400 [Paspalum vaginatum]